MPDLSLTQAQAIVAAALAEARRLSLKPVVVAVLDARGACKALAAEDGTSLKRAEIAHGKAHGALAMGIGSRAIAVRAAEAHGSFIAAVSHVAGGALIPAPGGVLARDAGGALLGAVGISGDTSDNDERAAMAGIAAAGLAGDPG